MLQFFLHPDGVQGVDVFVESRRGEKAPEWNFQLQVSDILEERAHGIDHLLRIRFWIQIRF